MLDNNPIFIDVDSVTGETTGTVYPGGQFKIVRYLTLAQKLDASRLMESQAKGIDRDLRALDLAGELAFLTFHIIDAPAWWPKNGLGLLDEAPVWAVSAKVREAQKPPEVSKPEEKKV